MAARIAASLSDVAHSALPIRMYVAGGTALHFHTGERVSVDATFSRRIALPESPERIDPGVLDVRVLTPVARHQRERR